MVHKWQSGTCPDICLFLLLSTHANTNMPANLENSSVATGLEKVSFHSNPKERECQRMLNYWTIALISQASKVMLKIIQARLQQYMNHEILDVKKLVLDKAEEPEIKLPTSAWSSKKQESSRKTFISALFTMPKPLTVWITINCGNTRPPDLPLEKSVCKSGSNK